MGNIQSAQFFGHHFFFQEDFNLDLDTKKGIEVQCRWERDIGLKKIALGYVHGKPSSFSYLMAIIDPKDFISSKVLLSKSWPIEMFPTLTVHPRLSMWLGHKNLSMRLHSWYNGRVSVDGLG
eukprot:EC720687.1.p1 GENE.EC720687.1~~EC720687.1.p1  ORF type:complete len:122 (+),score=1.96 EC720687.1:65-430(+)